MIYYEEESVLIKLTDAWNKFCDLSSQHPDEARDFADGIHKCQYVIAMRSVRDDYPETFPAK